MYFYRYRGVVHYRGVRGDALHSRVPRHQVCRGCRSGPPPLAGDYAYILFAVGLFNASLFAASILPFSTAYTVCEGLGFESGVGRRFGEAPVFYWLYTLLIVAGGTVVLLIPGEQLVRIVLWSQVLNGVVLPFVLIFMLLLINKKELMGEYVNTRLFNVVAWVTTVVVVGLSLAWAVASAGGKAGG